MACVCGLDKDFNDCCGAIITQEKKASTPEELMRSRYSAYVRGDGVYLLDTSVKENQHVEDIKLIEEFSTSVEWLKLDVIRVHEKTVEFKAYYREGDEIKVLHESSSFIYENERWLYKDGELYHTKVERNESCPCGSGKKFKKCCS